MINKKMLDPIKELSQSVDTKTVNQLLAETDMKDFEMTKATIENIAEWCLNGNSDTEIRNKLSLNKHQWGVLVACCPTLLIVMQQSRAMAEVVLAGSLYQTAIGGKIVRKQQLAKVKVYNENHEVVGEKIEKHWVEEELPPNPLLLKFLAEHKLNEKLGENSKNNENDFKDIIDSASKDDLKLVEVMKQAEILNGK